MSKKATPPPKTGTLYKFDGSDHIGGGGSWLKAAAKLSGHELVLNYTSPSEGDCEVTIDLEDATVTSPDAQKSSRMHAIDITTKNGTLFLLSADRKEEHDSWLQSCAVASVPDAWPGGVGFNNQPLPLLYSMWIIQHTGNPASLASNYAPSDIPDGAGGRTMVFEGIRPTNRGVPIDVLVPSPFPALPLLKSVPSWQRKGLFLQKLRQCSIVFEGVSPERFSKDWEVKRNTLLEIIEFTDLSAKQLFNDYRVVDDTFTMIKLNLFRTLPHAPEPSGDPEVEESTFEDPQWTHLSIIYELLLRLTILESIDIALKKRVIDVSFLRQFMLLFDSEDPREREYLKTITHRIYSKMTQRRSIIRKVISNVFHEFIMEGRSDNGIAEMLEMLASIINGFAVPIKDEHRQMLMRSLIPLHKSSSLDDYHPHLSYCVALFAAKEHTLTRLIIPALLKLWPVAAAPKQLMLFNELEDLFEYTLESDVPYFAELMCVSLARCISAYNFQIAERALFLWSNERVTSLLLNAPAHQQTVGRLLMPAVFANATGHWHESIRSFCLRVLEFYATNEVAFFNQVKEAYEASQAAAGAAAATGTTSAAGTALAALGSPGSPSTMTTARVGGVGSPVLEPFQPSVIPLGDALDLPGHRVGSAAHARNIRGTREMLGDTME